MWLSKETLGHRDAMGIGQGMKVFGKECERVIDEEWEEVSDEEWNRVYDEEWDRVCDKGWDRVSETEWGWVSDKLYVVGWQGWRTPGNFPRAADDLVGKAGIRCTPVGIEKRKRCVS